MKKVSHSEKIIESFINDELPSYITSNDKYSIRDNNVYAIHKTGHLIYLFTKIDNDIYFNFSENNKKYQRVLFNLLYNNCDNFYLVTRNFIKDKYKVLDYTIKSMLNIFIEFDSEDIFRKNDISFRDILINQVRKFNLSDYLFSDEIVNYINFLIKDTIHPDYDNHTTYFRNIDTPMISKKEIYLNLEPKILKRVYRISCLIS